MLTQKSIARKEWHIISAKVKIISVFILLVALSGGWWLYNNPLPNLQRSGHYDKQDIKPVNIVLKPKINYAATKALNYSSQFEKSAPAHKKITTLKNKPAPRLQAFTPIIKDSVAQDSTPLDEMVVIGMASQKDAKPTLENNGFEKDKNTDKPVADQSVSAPGADTKNYFKTGHKVTIRGQVIREGDGAPLPGAIVKADGTNIGVVTDAHGRFTLYADSSKTELIVACTGYNTVQLNMQNHDSVKKIELEPNDSSLEEAIVTDYNKNTGNDKETKAHPHLGWDNFKKYLNENAISPTGKTGLIKLTFNVTHDGTITAIRIVKGSDKVTDQKAIDLINNGPNWVGNVNGQSERVNLLVKFDK